MTIAETCRALFRLQKGSRALDGQLGAIESYAGWKLPPEYREFLAFCGPVEGYPNGRDFVCLWNAQEVVRFNEAYHAKLYAPGLLLVGSNGCGEAISYDSWREDAPIVHTPFVGLSREHILAQASSLARYFEILGIENPTPNQRGDETELVELKPIIFGGDPKDPENKTFLNREKHIAFVNYWNALLANLRDPQTAP